MAAKILIYLRLRNVNLDESGFPALVRGKGRRIKCRRHRGMCAPIVASKEVRPMAECPTNCKIKSPCVKGLLAVGLVAALAFVVKKVFCNKN